MLKEYTFWFYCLLSVLVFTVPIDCRRLSRYARQASRRQEPDGPPPNIPDGPPPNIPDGPPDGIPPGIDIEGPANDQLEIPDKPPEDETTEEGEDNRVPIEITDLPQSVVDNALILDYGRYTTLSFHYEQKQWMYSPNYDICYEDYMKCYLTLINPMPVCVMHTTSVVKTYKTYCDAYFMNCKKSHRHWRLVGYGKCTVGFFGYPFLDDHY